MEKIVYCKYCIKDFIESNKEAKWRATPAN